MSRIFLLCLFFLSACSDKYILLVNKSEFSPDWKFSETGKESWEPAQVPGVVQMDLLRSRQIENPLFENNELKLQWISEKNWTYKAQFEITDSLLRFKSIDFIFEGLDTYAGVYINDTLLLSSDNMFVEWRIDVKKFLRRGANEIKINLYSPTAKAKSLADKLSYTIPSGETTEPRISPFIRKAPYQFGWDWSPRFLTMGIWKPIKMVAHDRVYITDINIRTIEIADTCAWLSADVTIKSQFDLSNVTVTVQDAFKQVRLRKGETTTEVKFKIFQPELWWPNGYGKQQLYDITAKLYVNLYLVDSVITRTGIRTIELSQDDDEWGRSFYFRVNGLPIFMKGANYVPQSNFPSDVSDSSYVKLINDAADVGMNMLRVWGGGIYEKDKFYDLCDEKGIMIWQDFMFAGNMLPGDSNFVKNVKREVGYQVKRLRNHPSIALWCGNNEMEVAWKNWGWQEQFKISKKDSAKIYSDYLNLFESAIPNITSLLDPNRPYISSSPQSNWGKKENFSYGNMHYWGVWHGEEPIDSFRVNIPRFMTEYGMQSYPSFSSLRNNTNENRTTLNSDFIKNRQRSYKGNGLLLRYIEDYYGKVGNAEDLSYLSQLNQAEAMRIAIENHRKEARFCMGTLFWQLNDVWDGASWSTLEHNGKWKAAHYGLNRLYAQDILIVNTHNDTTKIYLQTENTSGQTGILQITVKDFKGRVVANYKRDISVGYLVAETVFELPLAKVVAKKNPAAFFIHAQLINENDTIASAIHYFRKPVELQLPAPNLKYEVVQTDSVTLVNISSEVLVKNAMLEFNNCEGQFSDNYFDLLPGENKIVIFKSPSHIPLTKDNLIVKWYINSGL